MWCWVLLSITLPLNIVAAQPVQQENVIDQSTGRKCCPCPDDPTEQSPEQDLQLQLPGTSDQLASGTTSEGRSALSVDGCSSQFRDADTLGASSILFPSKMRASRPFVSLEDEKDEIKPLLHPEVDLATSVVDTLREATEEEYKDALQRDAAKSASKLIDNGEKNVKNLVNVFMSPENLFANDHSTSKASDIEETNPTNLLTDLLKLTLPKPESIKKLLDRESKADASNERRILSIPANDRHVIMAKMDPLNILNNDHISRGIFKSAFETNDSSKPIIFPKIMGIIPKKNTRRLIDSDSKNLPSNVEERFYYPEGNSNIKNKLNNNKLSLQKNRDPNENVVENVVSRKNLLEMLSSKNRDAASDLLKDVLRNLEASRKLLNLPDLLNLRNDVSEKKTADKKNTQLPQQHKTTIPATQDGRMKTEIIEVTDSNIPNSMKVINTNLSDYNHIPSFNQDEPVERPLNMVKNPVTNNKKKTKILTHIPISNNEDEDDLESVDNNDQMNQVEYGDKNNLSPSIEDSMSNTSNNFPNYELLSKNTDSTGFLNNNPREIVEQLIMPQDRSSSIVERVSKARNNIQKLGENFSKDCPDQTTLRNRDTKINQINDMTSDASEHLTNMFDNLKSSQILPSLFESVDNPFDGLNNNLADIFTNSASFIPNILSTNEDGISRIEEGLSRLAGTSNFKSALPSLEPLENMNLPSLNSYRSQFVLPEALDLSPVILEPSMGSLNSIYGNRKASDFLGNPITLPGINDVSESFLETAQNLLSTPLETTSRNVIEDTLRSGQVLSENFKVQAKNAVNNLQKHIEGTLKETGISRTSDSGNPLILGANIMENLKTRHEDFGDKLKGIHYDLNDRLETLRNNILNHLPELDPSMLAESSDLKITRESFTLPNKNVGLARAQNKPISGKMNSTPRELSENSKLFNLLKSSSVLSPAVNNLFKIVPSEYDDFKSSKISSSSPLRLNSDKNIFPKSRTVPSYIKSKRPNSNSAPVLRHRNSNRQSKIKSSPRDSMLQRSNLPFSLPSLKLFRDSNKSLDSSTINIPKDVPKTTDWSKVSTKPKVTSSSILKSSTLKRPQTRVTTHEFKLGKDVVSSPSLVSEHIRPFATSEILKKALPTDQLSKFLWLKSVDNTFLNKMRDAVNERLTSLAPKAVPPEGTLDKTDMSRSATENSVILNSNSELMKENVPYTCKMVCTHM